MKKIVRYFLQGSVFMLPILFTLYLVYVSVRWVDELIPRVFSISLFPGAGILIIVAFLIVIGYLTSSFWSKPAFSTIDNILYRIPVVNVIHSSTKDVLGAFVGDKKRFNSPVLVKTDPERDVYRVGFITRTDLSVLKQTEKVAVYFPHSYNISGNLLIVPADTVFPIDANSAEIMKFVVSGGVSGLNH